VQPSTARSSPTPVVAVAAIAVVASGGLALAILGGLGAVPDPWAGDADPLPLAIETMALGGPQVAVSAAWVIASIAGVVALGRSAPPIA
jgi:hypothetical protein